MQRVATLVFIVAATILIAVSHACSHIPHHEHSPASVQDSSVIASIIKNISDSSVASIVRRLEAFQQRCASCVSRDSVILWISDRFHQDSITDITTSNFRYGATWQKNIVATIPGTTSADKEIIIGAHYDDVWNQFFAGADDNASGVSALIEMARVLKLTNYKPKCTLRFIAFACEEQGLIGSNDYAVKAKAANKQIELMLNFDMIAYRDTSQIDHDAYIVQYAGCEDDASLEYSLMRRYTSLRPIYNTDLSEGSDSWSFYRQGYNVIYNTEADFNPWHHSSMADTSGHLDFKYAADIIRSALALIITRDDEITGVAQGPAQRPIDFTLYQNYPNPFNPSTIISYQIPTVGDVSLKIYDVLGKEVESLVNEKEQPGKYEVKWNALNRSSGVYFYKLQAGSFTQTKKLLLIR